MRREPAAVSAIDGECR